MWLGVPELVLILGVFVVPVIVAIVLVAGMVRRLRRQAREHGYDSLRAYLRAAPQTDQEKRDATDLALKGLVLCLLGLILPPVLLVGIFPFFYGARKVAYASMGLGIVDDGRQ
jgi:hypothetical protein